MPLLWPARIVMPAGFRRPAPGVTTSANPSPVTSAATMNGASLSPSDTGNPGIAFITNGPCCGAYTTNETLCEVPVLCCTSNLMGGWRVVQTNRNLRL